MTLLAAQPAAAAPDATSPEIIVTGERVARSLAETPSSVAVIDEQEIESSGADRLDQLLASIPNVQLGDGSQGPAIRGIDTTGPLSALPAFLGGNRPRMALVVDGRPVTYNEFVFGAFPVWDVERIEVFRSPQTTTQGRNSIAGAIFVNSNDPALEPDYRARAILGDFRTRQLSAVASMPLGGDAVALRVAGDFKYSRTTSRILDEIEHGDPNHDLFGLLRAKLLLAPSPSTRATLTYVHSHSQAPQIVGISAPFRRRRDDDAGYGVFRINVDSLTAAVRHEAAPDLTADLMLTAGDSSARRLAFPGLGQTRNNGRDWSAELVLNWSPEESVRLVGGVSHNHVRLKQFINLSLLSGSIGRFRDWQDGTGLFADLTVSPFPRTSLNAGLRYQRDRQERRGALTADSFIVPVDFVGTFEAWLPKLTLAYDAAPGVRVGALVQKAYNPGGTTIRVDTSQPDNFDAETLWDYELFGRAEFAGGQGTASVNAFWYDMRNAQRAESILVTTPSGRRAGFANLFNVPRARSLGAEAELGWRFGTELQATIGIGLLSTRILRGAGESAGLEGKEFERSPHFTGAAAIDWVPAERLRLSAQLRRHGPYFTDLDNSRDTRIGSGTSVDVRAEYGIGRIQLFAQVRNLFDRLNLLQLYDPESGEAESPRMIAFGLESRF